jgi:hypothetical protein
VPDVSIKLLMMGGEDAETGRVWYQNKFGKLVRLVGYLKINLLRCSRVT